MSKLEKLPDEQIAELQRLGIDRVGEAAMSVIQLIDDPTQAAKVATCFAATLLQLAGLFAHTASVMSDENKPHSRIVGDMLLLTVAELLKKPPTAKQQAEMQRIKREYG